MNPDAYTQKLAKLVYAAQELVKAADKMKALLDEIGCGGKTE